MTTTHSHRWRDHVHRLGNEVSVLAGVVKPKLRGWLHAVMAPLVLVASIVLIILAPTPGTKIACVVFGLTALALFTVSGFYHRGRWTPIVSGVLRLIDHSNIFLIIAGTYTPLSVALLPSATAWLVLSIVWGGALAAIGIRIAWPSAPRWLFVPIYLALGWVAVWFLPQFAQQAGSAVLWLIIAGGLAYTAGAIVYALKRPNPSQQWFGYHEVFHALTVVGYVCHCVAIYIAVLTLR